MVFCIDGVYLFSWFCCSVCGSGWVVCVDICFVDVIVVCVVSLCLGQDGIWIMLFMQEVYVVLYWLGYVYLVEVFVGDCLVGGIYGVVIGWMFFGESMFSVVSGGFKVVLVVFVW